MAHDLAHDLFHNRAGAMAGCTKAKIVFVGTSMSFSDRILAVYRGEFPDYDFFRVPSLADVSAARRLHDDVHLVVFEAAMMQVALDQPERFTDAVGRARIVFSLADPHDAARFLSARGDRERLDNIGFLPLNGQMDVWISVMHLFLCGQSFLPQCVAEALIDDLPQGVSVESLAPNLTSREWEVLELVAQGTQNKIIAADLDLSVHTVKLHIHNLLKKIGVSNRTCAASWYMQHQTGRGEQARGPDGGT